MLHKLQTSFMDSVYKERDDLLSYVKEFGNLTNEERFGVYRNSAFVSLKETLLNTFPNVSKTVDIQFFRYLTHEYIKQNPPSKGCLMYYGETFPKFIQNFEPLKDHPYLVDLATLEWLYAKSYDADETSIANMQEFFSISESNLHSVKISLNPSVHLIKSTYAVHSLWTAADEDIENPELNINSSENAIIYRNNDDFNVYVNKINDTSLLFLKALNDNQSFIEAIELALENNSKFNPQIILEEGFKEGWFSNVSVS